jgi:hypothetical protein
LPLGNSILSFLFLIIFVFSYIDQSNLYFDCQQCLPRGISMGQQALLTIEMAPSHPVTCFGVGTRDVFSPNWTPAPAPAPAQWGRAGIGGHR